MDLAKQINIGRNLESKLKMLGITSVEELTAIGCENVFLKLLAYEPKSCINTLYAIEGAIQGIRWHDLSDVRKQELLTFFRMSTK